MADADFSLMLEHFKRIHEDMAQLKGNVASLIQRVSAMDAHLAGLHATEVAQFADLNEIKQRLDRIERRLGLREEA